MLFMKRKTEEFHFTPEQEACLARCRELTNDELRILNGGGSYKGMPSSVQMQQGLSGGSSDDNSNSSSGKSESKGHHGMPSDVEAMLEHSGSSSVTETSSNAGQTTVISVTYPTETATQPSAPKQTESTSSASHGSSTASGSGSTNYSSSSTSTASGSSSSSSSDSSSGSSSYTSSTNSSSSSNGTNQSDSSGSENTSSVLSGTAITFPAVLPDSIETDGAKQEAGTVSAAEFVMPLNIGVIDHSTSKKSAISRDAASPLVDRPVDFEESIPRFIADIGISFSEDVKLTIGSACGLASDLLNSDVHDFITVNNGFYVSQPVGEETYLYMQTGNSVTSFPFASITKEDSWKLSAGIGYTDSFLSDVFSGSTRKGNFYTSLTFSVGF